MAEQTEQLEGVHQGIQDVNVYLKLASKELRAFVRRTATDKLIMSFVCLIVVGIIFIIIWQSIKGKNSQRKTISLTLNLGKKKKSTDSAGTTSTTGTTTTTTS